MRVVLVWLAPAVAVCVLGACHLVSGVGDLQFVESGPGSGGAGGDSTSPTTTTSTAVGGGGGGAGGAGGAGGGPLCLIDLQEAFESGTIDSSVWDESAQAATVAEVGGQLVVTPVASTPGSWGQVMSHVDYDLRDCAVLLELVLPLNAGGDAKTVFSVSNGNYENSVGFVVTDGSLAWRQVVGGAETVIASTPYAADSHRWLRLRGAAGLLYFETSADGVVWAVRGQTAAPGYVNKSRVTLGAGTPLLGATTPGEARFDNVNSL